MRTMIIALFSGGVGLIAGAFLMVLLKERACQECLETIRHRVLGDALEEDRVRAGKSGAVAQASLPAVSAIPAAPRTWRNRAGSPELADV